MALRGRRLHPLSGACHSEEPPSLKSRGIILKQSALDLSAKPATPLPETQPGNQSSGAEASALAPSVAWCIPSAIAGLLSGILLSLVYYVWRHSPFGLRFRLLAAMRKKRIYIVYQPLVEMASGNMVGVEALARWTHDGLGPISPETFLKWAEAAGVGRRLTRYIVRNALAGVSHLLREDQNFYISINVTPRDVEDLSFSSYLLGVVKEFDIPTGQVVLEVTESLEFLIDEPRALLSHYRRAGFRVFIDDFGAGYANLNNLLNWEVDGIKLDSTLVRFINANIWAGAILDSVFAMTRRLNIRVLVEGIETQAQALYVLQHAPEAIGQGWLFGRPCAPSLLPEITIAREFAS
ncbi:EAL domain-containing protein [Pseudomonas sp. NFXW11]|uniref:EAL domain-containing protein n=1 Tax=Pseudomonas sp. NFXW11 TaxID=2819531 RepID=UPI003CF5E14A